MSSKKKNAITLLLLCLALLICLLLYFFLPKSNEKEDTKEEETLTVDTITADTIQTMVLEKNGKKIWSLKHYKDNWKFTDDVTTPVNEDKVTEITDLLNPVKATKSISTTEDNADYGLNIPTMTFVVIATDGREYRYDIGTKVPKEDMGYYVKTNAGDTIYCIKDLVTGIDIEKNRLIEMDTLPTIKSDYMTYIQVKNRSGKDFEAKKVSDKEKVDFYSNWNITKPYKKPLATSATNWTTTLGYFNSLTFTELVDYKSDNLKKYGLDTPSSQVTVRYYEAQEGYTPTATATPSTVTTGASSSEDTYVIPENKRVYKVLKLSVGKKIKGGYYVCETGKTNVYKMDIDVIENMTKLDAYDSMDHCVYSVLATSIRGYDVSYGDTTLKVTRTAVAKEDDKKSTATPSATESTESGTAVENTADKNQKNIWTLNGKTISDDKEEDFLTPYSTAYLLEFSEKAEAKDNVVTKSAKPVLTIVYHEEKRDVTVKYLPYDGTNFYRVDKNGMDYFLVDKLQVDDIIEKFKGIEKLAK